MSSNPQWKMDFQPPPTANMQDIIDMQQSSNQGKSYRNGSYSSEFPSSPRDSFASQGATSNSNSNRYSMGTYGSDSNNSHNDYNSSSNTSQHYDPPNHPNRETGIIEKLLVSPSAPRSNRHSYGFIQCCERQARLFFHFSQFSGNIEHLKIGDPVEFEMTYDRRTGKPIASTVVKIAPEVVLSEARVTGTVTTELRGEGVGDSTGRISYENRGECFFLPYTKDDVEGNVTLHSGDAVSFQIATNQRGNLGACHVRLENPAHPVKYHGVVCSMKESFGFIERADVVKEIFFHFSEAKVKDDINLGDDVEFIIQTRNGKEVACFITRLPSGSVIFEDVAPDITKGQVLKPLERGSAPRHANDPLPGRIRFRAPDHSETDVQFGDKDQLGEFTLRHGDWVQFQVATDRRDQLKRATYISLLDESFNMSGERREKGVVSSLKDGFGFIRCVEREPHLFFHFSEVLLPQQPLNIGDEVEFTLDPVTSYSTSQQPSAKRIKHLSPGTVQFENLVEKGVHGVVSKEAVPRISSPSKSSQDACGLINYLVSGAKKSLSFFAKDVDGKVQPRQGEKVIFDIFQVKRTKELIGMNIVVQNVATNGSNGANSNGANSNGANPSPRPMLQGFIAALKDGFGFIETKDHDKEVFFHFSNFEGSVDILELGRDVEYILGRQGGSSGGCCSAELVRAVPKGTISVAKPTDIQLQGSVTRTLRALNPDQREYSGIIEAANGACYEFGIMGLSCKRDLLRIGDPVSFYVDTASRAANIVPVRKKRRAIVDSIKGGFGFLSFEIEEGKKLIFYMSDVNGPPNSLQPGDVVEFILVTNHRNGKSLACNVTKIVNFDGEIYDPNKDGGEQSTARCSSNSFGSAEMLRPITKGARRNEQQLQGIVTKVIKPFNSEQPQVNGIIEATNGNSYEFILLGLACKRELFRNGDTVTFQLDLQNRATNIVPVRKKKRGTVETIKGTYGFIINPDSEDGKKLLFYTSEVRGPPGCLQAGDQVEYTVVTNQRNNKTTACNITKVVESSPPARPERLISRLRTASLEEQAGPRLVVVRKPRGPDGTRGFRPRVPINPENPFQ